MSGRVPAPLAERLDANLGDARLVASNGDVDRAGMLLEEAHVLSQPWA